MSAPALIAAALLEVLLCYIYPEMTCTGLGIGRAERNLCRIRPGEYEVLQRSDLESFGDDVAVLQPLGEKLSKLPSGIACSSPEERLQVQCHHSPAPHRSDASLPRSFGFMYVVEN